MLLATGAMTELMGIHGSLAGMQLQMSRLGHIHTLIHTVA